MFPNQPVSHVRSSDLGNRQADGDPTHDLDHHLDAGVGGYSLGLARSTASSGCSRTSLLAMWQAKQTGDAAASVSCSLSAGTSLHSTDTPSAPSSAGLRPAQSISPKGWPHHAQTLPSYHFVRMLRTMQPSGEASIWLRHSCPQPARSGQREHEDSRSSGVFPSPVAAASRAPPPTPAGLWFSGHVITRLPRYFHQ